MRGSISLGGLPAARVPAVVLGDLSLIRPHGMAGIPVVVATADPRDVALRSRFVYGSCILPGEGPAAASESADLLLRLGERIRAVCGHKPPLVYGSDRHLEMILDHRKALSEYYLFTMSPDHVARAMIDKERFYDVAEAAGIRVPRTRTPGAGRRLDDLREPLLVKPRKKAHCAPMRETLFVGGAKARVFATRKELLAHPDFARFEADLIVQEHIPGDVTALVSFHGFTDEAGRLLGSFCGRKVRTWPKVAGESSFIELTIERDVRELGEQTAARLGLRGPFKIDFLRDARTGELFVLEINARFNLWHYLGAVHGVNLPAIAYEYHLFGRGANIVRHYLPRVRWVDLYRDYKAFQEAHQEGAMTLGEWLSSLARSRKVYDTFAWNDPAPLSGWVKGFLSGRWHHGAVRDPRGRPR